MWVSCGVDLTLDLALGIRGGSDEFSEVGGGFCPSNFEANIGGRYEDISDPFVEKQVFLNALV